MAKGAGIPAGKLAAAVVVVSIVAAGWWWFADATSSGLRVLGLYRESRFLVLLAGTGAASILVLFLLGSRNAALAGIATGFGLVLSVALLELTAILGLVDFRLLLQGTDRNPNFEHELRRQGRPDLEWEGESDFDLVERMGLPSDPQPVRFSTDRFGLRNPDKAGPFEVFVVGDSIAVGMPVDVELVMGQALEREVAAPTLTVAEVGFSPQEGLRRLRSTGLPIADTVVLHVIFEGNDLVDSERWYVWRSRPFQHADWPLAGFVRSALPLLKWTRGAAASTRHASLEVAGAPRTPYFLYDSAASARELREMPRLERDLEQAIGELADERARYAIVFVPAKLTTLHALLRFPEASPLAEPSLADSPFGAALERFAARLEIPFANAGPELRTCLAAGELPFYERDTHLTACGHAAVARSAAPLVLGLRASP